MMVFLPLFKHIADGWREGRRRAFTQKRIGL